MVRTNKPRPMLQPGPAPSEEKKLTRRIRRAMERSIKRLGGQHGEPVSSDTYNGTNIPIYPTLHPRLRPRERQRGLEGHDPQHFRPLVIPPFPAQVDVSSQVLVRVDIEDDQSLRAERVERNATSSYTSANEDSRFAQSSTSSGSSSDHSIYHPGSEDTSIELQTPDNSFPSGYQLSPYDVEYDTKESDLDVFDGAPPGQPPLLIETVLEHADAGRAELSGLSVDNRILAALDAFDYADGLQERFLDTITEEDLAALSAYPSARSFASAAGDSLGCLASSFPAIPPVSGQSYGISDSAVIALQPPTLSGRHQPSLEGSGKYLDSLLPRLYPRSLATLRLSKNLLAPIFLPPPSISPAQSVIRWLGTSWSSFTTYSEEVADVD